MTLRDQTRESLASTSQILRELNRQNNSLKTFNSDSQPPLPNKVNVPMHVAQANTPRPFYSIPKTRPWVEGIFDMGKGTLTITRYEKGQAVDSVSITPARIPTSKAIRPGAYSGDFGKIDQNRGKDFRNESEAGDIADAGPVPLGTYSIRLIPEGNDPLVDNYMEKYKEHGVQEPWYMLDRQDGDSKIDTTQVNGVERDGFRLHMGYLSIGCVTVHPEGNQQKWRKVEDLIPNGDPWELVGQIKVIDTEPGPGNVTYPQAGIDLEL